MTERLADKIIITDPLAEGARQLDDEGQTRHQLKQTSTMPPLRLNGLTTPPSAETGLLTRSFCPVKARMTTIDRMLCAPLPKRKALLSHWKTADPPS